MKDIVEIIQEAPDKMTRKVWRFDYRIKWSSANVGAGLVFYAGQHRETTRKRWRNDAIWWRLDPRESTLKKPPEITKEMQHQVLIEFASSLRFYVDDQPRKV